LYTEAGWLADAQRVSTIIDCENAVERGAFIDQLRYTLGRAVWLDSLDAEEWARLLEATAPFLLKIGSTLDLPATADPELPGDEQYFTRGPQGGDDGR
jgi:hypothetical protein